MLADYRFVVVSLCVSVLSVSRLSVVVSANSTDTTITQDINGITEKFSAEDTNNQDNVYVTANGNATLDGTNSSEVTPPLGNASTASDSKTVSRPECVINRGWFRWKVHLQTGHSYFSMSDCTLKVCNEKGDLDFYPCNRLDVWDVLRPSIDREVNEGQLKCLKSGCI